RPRPPGAGRAPMSKVTAPGRPGRRRATQRPPGTPGRKGGGGTMLDPAVRCVVGIDVAKRSHVVCALDAPTGALHQKAFKIEATAAGYAELGARLAHWGAPPELLI